MGLTQDAGAVSDALFDAAELDNMFLIVSAGAGCEFWFAAKDRFDAVADGRDEFTVFVGVDGMDDHQVFDVVLEFRVLRLKIFEHCMNLATNLREGFLGEKAAIEDGPGTISNTGSLRTVLGLAAKNGVHVDACVA